MKLVIKYTTLGQSGPGMPYVIIFSIVSMVDEIFYALKLGDAINPELYNCVTGKLNVPNIDHWLQANTHQKYSYKTLLDMTEAFAYGMLSAAYGKLPEFISQIVTTTKEIIFQTNHLSGYITAYDVELTPEVKIVEAIRDIRSNWDTYKSNPNFHNKLCRWWKYCRSRIPDSGYSKVFEQFMQRLGTEPGEPVYPDTSSYDKDVTELAIHKICGVPPKLYANVPAELTQYAHVLLNRK